MVTHGLTTWASDMQAQHSMGKLQPEVALPMLAKKNRKCRSFEKSGQFLESEVVTNRV
jgi:hypothetical protein